LSSLWVAFVLSSTAILAVTVGILAAYGAVNTILYAFAHQARQTSVGTPVLIEKHASGD
jgi:hypothetical protein